MPSDDPREILRTAGLECIEVGAYEKRLEYLAEYDRLHGDDAYDEADAAIDKLECLVAKYKWQRGKLAERLLTERIAAAVKMTHDRNFLNPSLSLIGGRIVSVRRLRKNGKYT